MFQLFERVEIVNGFGKGYYGHIVDRILSHEARNYSYIIEIIEFPNTARITVEAENLKKVDYNKTS